MERQILLQRLCLKGTTILENIAVLVILATVLTCVITGCLDRINKAKYEKMIDEMVSMAQASIDYYDSQYPNVWPASVNDLEPLYMYKVTNTNPWGNPYSLNFQNSLVVVSTIIPSGIANSNPEGPLLKILTGSTTDQISIAQSIPMGISGRLLYEKNNPS